MLHDEEIGTLGEELMKAGLHVGRGKGALLVRRHDVEKAFLRFKRDGIYYAADAIAEIIQASQNLKTDITRNVGIHITKMYNKGLLERIKVGREFRYRAKKSFTKLSNTHHKNRHPARGKPKKELPSLVKIAGEGIDKQPSPPLQKKRSLEQRMETLHAMAEQVARLAADLVDDYQEMKKQLEKII